MRPRSLRFAAACLWLAPLAAAPAAEDPQKPAPVKYVFLFIGDGMAENQVALGNDFMLATEGRPMAFAHWPDRCLTGTLTADGHVTESAAAATAIACGQKTRNGFLGFDTEQNKLVSVAYAALAAGKRVGIITSVTLNHATPAGFYAYNTNRNDYYAIGLDLVESGFHYFGGGGLENAGQEDNPRYRGNLYALAAEAGYAVARGPEAVLALRPGSETVKALSVVGDGSLSIALGRKPGALGLADFTRQGIEFLDGPDGFFLMVEGGQIDWLGHTNEGAASACETADFAHAVDEALAFARRNPGETLVVVTGDHETGGMGYEPGSAGLLARQDRLISAINGTLVHGQPAGETSWEWVQRYLTRMTGLVFSSDPGADGANPALRLEPGEEDALRAAFDGGLADGRLTDAAALATAAARMLERRAGQSWSTGGHTDARVVTAAWGARSGLFAQCPENADIGRALMGLIAP